MFDAFLGRRAPAGREPFRPFDIETDYKLYVDGKPRYAGVRSFLASRNISLAEGTPKDIPDRRHRVRSRELEGRLVPRPEEMGFREHASRQVSTAPSLSSARHLPAPGDQAGGCRPGHVPARTRVRPEQKKRNFDYYDQRTTGRFVPVGVRPEHRRDRDRLRRARPALPDGRPAHGSRRRERNREGRLPHRVDGRDVDGGRVRIGRTTRLRRASIVPPA